MTPPNILSVAKEGHYDVVIQLIEDGCDANDVDEEKRNALMLASENGHYRLVQLLLNHKIDTDAVDENGCDALMLASQNGHHEVVHLLIQNGIDVNKVDSDGWSALRYAVENQHSETVNVLLKGGSNVNAVDNEGFNALLVSSADGYFEIVELLLQHGCDINRLTSEGRNALILASEKGHTEVVRLLFQHTSLLKHCYYIDVNLTDELGFNALMLASKNGHVSIVQLLIENNCDVNLANSNGNNSLHLASQYGHHTVVDFLLKSGSDILSVNNKGWDALMYATLFHHNTVVELLLNHSSDQCIDNENEWISLILALENGLVNTVDIFKARKRGLKYYSMKILKQCHSNIEIDSSLWCQLFVCLKYFSQPETPLLPNISLKKSSLQDISVCEEDQTFFYVDLEKINVCNMQRSFMLLTTVKDYWEDKCSLEFYEILGYISGILSEFSKDELINEFAFYVYQKCLHEIYKIVKIKFEDKCCEFISTISKHDYLKVTSKHILENCLLDKTLPCFSQALIFDCCCLIRECSQDSNDFKEKLKDYNFTDLDSFEIEFPFSLFAIKDEQEVIPVVVEVTQLRETIALDDGLNKLTGKHYRQRMQRKNSGQSDDTKQDSISDVEDTSDDIPKEEKLLSGQFPAEYQIDTNPFAEGKFCSVYYARSLHDSDNILFVAKKFSLSKLTSNDFERSQAEAILKIKHRRIVQFYGFTKTDKEIILYFENVKKGTLSSYISKHGVLDETSTKLFTIQILEGLHYLHSNRVLHLDLRGNNILMEDDRNIKLTDIGISKIFPLDIDKQRRKRPFSCSTSETECFDDETKIDIWSIGCVTIEMITGSLPSSTGHAVPVSKVELSAQVVYDLPAQVEYNLPNFASSNLKEFLKTVLKQNPKEIPSAEWLLQNDQFITDEQHLEMLQSSLPSAATAVGGLGEVIKDQAEMTQDDSKCILNHFAELLKLYWSVINKASGGQDVVLENYHKDEVEASTWFDCIKSSEVTKSFTNKHSEADVNSALKEPTGPLEVKELVKIASLLLAYNNSLVVDLRAVACVEDVEAHSFTKNLSALVEKMSGAIETFLAFIPWDYTSCENEMQELLPSLEVALNEFSVSVDTGTLENLHLEKQMVVYDVDILCAVIGLRVDFSSYLKRIKTELWFHQEESYHILSWIKSFGENMFPSNNVFYNMGFTEKKSKFILNYIPAHLFDLQSPLYWAESYTESMFRCHPLLSDSKDFPYKSLHNDYPYTPENIPFKATINFRHPRQHGTAEVNIINVSVNQDIQNVIDNYLLQNSRNRHILLFHGTGHSSAVSILEQGINIKEGHAAQDFSNKEGFYLSYSYHEAKDWAFTHGFDPAVLVFRIPQMLLMEADNNGRDLTPDTPDNRREWEETIRYCRNGYNGDEPSRFRTYSFIKGHMCFNPKEVKKGHTPSKHSPPKLQLCVKKKQYAQGFGSTSHILCAVFYKQS